jgi:hypothetical protein
MLPIIEVVALKTGHAVHGDEKWPTIASAPDGPYLASLQVKPDGK